MKSYGLYWLRAAFLGFGLNFVITNHLMNNHDYKYHQAAPLAALVAVNCSFFADRLIFRRLGEKTRKTKP